MNGQTIMRAFLAIELPMQVRKTLEELGQSITRARVAGLTPVRPENMHLTLKFFRELEDRLTPDVIEATHRIAQAQQPFRLTLGQVGAFPSSRNARVLWVGLEGDTDSLREFHRRLDDAFAKIGIPRDSRDFNPHLTIARLDDHTPPTDRRRATEALFSAPVRAGQPIAVRSVVLMQSILGPGGPAYTRLTDATLTAS